MLAFLQCKMYSTNLTIFYGIVLATGFIPTAKNDCSRRKIKYNFKQALKEDTATKTHRILPILNI